MAKRDPFKKDKPDQPTSVIAQQLENFILNHIGGFDWRNYDKFCIELIESSACDVSIN